MFCIFISWQVVNKTVMVDNISTTSTLNHMHGVITLRLEYTPYGKKKKKTSKVWRKTQEKLIEIVYPGW
jgi:hypothetical protein